MHEIGLFQLLLFDRCILFLQVWMVAWGGWGGGGGSQNAMPSWQTTADLSAHFAVERERALKWLIRLSILYAAFLWTGPGTQVLMNGPRTQQL